MAFDRNAFRQGIQSATKMNNERAAEPSGFHSYVKKGQRPKFTKVPEGMIIFDIIPFIVNNNFNASYTKGSVNYMLETYVHMNVGPNNEQIVCPAKTFGKPCPICEEKQRREAQGEPWDTLKVFAPKRRTIYNIWVHDRAKTEENKGVQVFEIAHFSLENELQKIVEDPITHQYVFFADPDNGKMICFTRTGTGKNNTKYGGYRFLDRPSPIPNEILEQAEDLTSLVEVLPYEEIYAKFHGVPNIQQPEDDATASPNTGGYGYTPSRNVYEDADGAVATGSESVSYDESTPPWEEPTQRKEVKPNYSYTPPVNEKSAPTQKGEPVCPLAAYGGMYGKTVDKYPQCTSCELWDGCSQTYDAHNK